jgi:hypothetical protein
MRRKTLGLQQQLKRGAEWSLQQQQQRAYGVKGWSDESRRDWPYLISYNQKLQNIPRIFTQYGFLICSVVKLSVCVCSRLWDDMTRRGSFWGSTSTSKRLTSFHLKSERSVLFSRRGGKSSCIILLYIMVICLLNWIIPKRNENGRRKWRDSFLSLLHIWI